MSVLVIHHVIPGMGINNQHNTSDQQRLLLPSPLWSHRAVTGVCGGKRCLFVWAGRVVGENVIIICTVLSSSRPIILLPYPRVYRVQCQVLSAVYGLRGGSPRTGPVNCVDTTTTTITTVATRARTFHQPSRPPPHHPTGAGIAALAANAAFTRRQRLRWRQLPPPSPSPPADPPTNDSNNTSPHRLRQNRDDYD